MQGVTVGTLRFPSLQTDVANTGTANLGGIPPGHLPLLRQTAANTLNFALLVGGTIMNVTDTHPIVEGNEICRGDLHEVRRLAAANQFRLTFAHGTQAVNGAGVGFVGVPEDGSGGSFLWYFFRDKSIILCSKVKSAFKKKTEGGESRCQASLTFGQKFASLKFRFTQQNHGVI